MGSGSSFLAENKYSSHSYDNSSSNNNSYSYNNNNNNFKKEDAIIDLEGGDRQQQQLTIYQHRITKDVSFFVQDDAASFFSDPSGSDYNELSISSSVRDPKVTVQNSNNPHQLSEGRRSLNSAGSYEEREQRMMIRSSNNIPMLMDHHDKDGKSYCITCKNEFEVMTQMQWDHHLKACSSRSSLKKIFEELDKQVNLAFLALSLDAVPLNSLVKSYIAGIISVKYYCNINQVYFLRNEIRGYLQGMMSDSKTKDDDDDDDDALVLTSEVGLGNKLITALEVVRMRMITQ